MVRSTKGLFFFVFWIQIIFGTEEYIYMYTYIFFKSEKTKEYLRIPREMMRKNLGIKKGRFAKIVYF